MENSMEVPKKTKNRVTIWSSNPIPGHVSRKDKNADLKRYMHPSVHCSMFYNSQDTEVTWTSINREMDKNVEKVKVKSLSHVRLFATPMDCSPPGSSVHGIFQARVLEWVAISFSRGSSQPRDRTPVSRTAGRCFTIWATRECGTYILTH